MRTMSVEVQAVDAPRALLECRNDHLAACMDAQVRTCATGSGVEPFASQQRMRLIGQDQFDRIELGALRLVHGHRPRALVRRQLCRQECLQVAIAAQAAERYIVVVGHQERLAILRSHLALAEANKKLIFEFKY